MDYSSWISDGSDCVSALRSKHTGISPYSGLCPGVHFFAIIPAFEAWSSRRRWRRFAACSVKVCRIVGSCLFYDAEIHRSGNGRIPHLGLWMLFQLRFTGCSTSSAARVDSNRAFCCNFCAEQTVRYHGGMGKNGDILIMAITREVVIFFAAGQRPDQHFVFCCVSLLLRLRDKFTAWRSLINAIRMYFASARCAYRCQFAGFLLDSLAGY